MTHPTNPKNISQMGDAAQQESMGSSWLNMPQGPIWPKPARRRMKQSRATIFAISALGLLLSPLYAQTQSQPQPVACPLEGPSIADTLKYLNDVLAVVKITTTNTTMSKYSLSISGEELILSSYLQSANSANVQLRLFVNQLDCHPGTTFPYASDGGGFLVSLTCAGLSSCEREYMTLDDRSWASSGSRIDLMIPSPGDRDHADRMTRALSHLVALLQQQYKQSHSDPNDPFARPQ
jgi:hypothetical protein